MKTRRVTMFVQNAVTMDNRVLKEARVLRDDGWTVTIVGKCTEPKFPREEDFEGIRIIRVGGEQKLRMSFSAWFDRSKAGITGNFAKLSPPDWLPTKVRGLSLRNTSKLRRTTITGLANIYRASSAALNLTEPLTYLYDWDQAVLDIADQIKADVWHSHDIDTLGTALRMRARHGGKVIYDAHEYWLDCNNVYSRFEYATWAFLEATLIRRADAVLTVSQSIADYLAKRYVVPVPKLVLNTPAFHRVARNDSLRQKFKLTNEFIVLYVGLITHKRGYEQLLDALPKIGETVLVFMGPGDAGYVNGLKEKAKSNGIENRVFFPGSVTPDEIQQYSASADVGVVVGQRGALSYECALPSKFFEYVFAGIPVATSDFIEMRKLIQEFDLGITFDERDPQSIADALSQIRNNMMHFKGEAWDARRQALVKEYAWETHKQVLVDLYETMAKGNPHN